MEWETHDIPLELATTEQIANEMQRRNLDNPCIIIFEKQANFTVIANRDIHWAGRRLRWISKQISKGDFK